MKELFGDLRLRDELRLSAVNSINWARILAQIVYYFVAAVALGAPERAVSFAVPTGNFGDVLAGYYAKRMGLPIERLIIATNENDILARALRSGRYEPRAVRATQSPSMDIQVSSNFERLLFEASGRDPQVVRKLMADFSANGRFAIPEDALGAHPRRLRRRERRRGGMRGGDDADVADIGTDDRPAQRRRRRRGAPEAGEGARDARRRARDGASGEVPRRGRTGDGRAPGRSRLISPISWSGGNISPCCRTTSAAVADFLRRTARAFA